MNNDCCSKCQAKAAKKKYLKKNEEESDEKDVKEKQKVAENENPKTDSNGEKGSSETSDQKDKKKKAILTWQHSSTKKEDKADGKKTLLSEKTGVSPPSYTAKPMMRHGGGPNPSNLWPISAAPRGYYPQFPMAPPPCPMAPMFGPYGAVGGPIQPYQTMPRSRVFNNGAYISPYPPMASYPYWQTRETNPMRRYTTYADNYSYCFI